MSRISCIMPTRDRGEFVAQAVRYFLRQDHPDKELIVVDDGAEPVRNLLPDDAPITYIRLEGRTPLGAKRNMACEAARGTHIAHWDDDDWCAPDRLSRQLATLRQTGAAVSGARDMLHYVPLTGEAWMYRRPAGDPPSFCGGSLLYERAAWQANPFLAVDIGEDEAFMRGVPATRQAPIDASSLYVAVLHQGNTAPRRLKGPRWERRPLEEVTRLLASDRAFYAGLRKGGAAPAAPRPPGDDITLVAPFVVYDGYGSLAEHLALGLVEAGAKVSLQPLAVDPAGLVPATRALLARQPATAPRGPVLYFACPGAELERYAGAQDLFISTMWEASLLPPGWAAALNRARAVLVPSRFLVDVCRRSGVTVPVDVVMPGVDPAIYAPVQRPERQMFTTLLVATMIGRKHAREAVEAWRRAFADDPEARLLIKSRFRHGHFASDDPRIRFVDENRPSRGIADLYAEADVLLALGSEGFGLPLVEGMATGLPVVAFDSEGQADICEDARGLVLPVARAGMEPCEDTPFGPGGVRGVPDVAQAAAQLRWAATHRQEARQMGAEAARWVARHRDVRNMGPATLEVMEARLTRPRPLARRVVLWTSSLGRPCGVAEYAAAVAACAGPRATAVGREPDLAGAAVLQIEHEFGLFTDAEMSRALALARHQRVPTVVTEHTVMPHASPWEAEAGALVSLTARGAEMLRRRLPGARVAHIPHGRPTWFPPRKTQRGRVIGAFGFLGRHKGFWRLLDVLRALPGTELLMFSHTQDPRLEAEWEQASRGLKVRRVRDYWPAEHCAARLAAEADVVAYHYDDTAHVSASGAIGVGLASGVPVLASTARWFEEFGEAVHREADPVAGVARLLEDTALRDRTAAAAQDFCHANDWASSARRHRALWDELAR